MHIEYFKTKINKATQKGQKRHDGKMKNNLNKKNCICERIEGNWKDIKTDRHLHGNIKTCTIINTHTYIHSYTVIDRNRVTYLSRLSK